MADCLYVVMLQRFVSDVNYTLENAYCSREDGHRGHHVYVLPRDPKPRGSGTEG